MITSCQEVKCVNDVNFILSIYGQFGAIRKPNSRRIVKTKTENRTKVSLTQLQTIALSKATILGKKH